jgi:dTMP kinase
MNDWAIGGRWPDLVVFIDVPVATLMVRLERRERDRFEREDRRFFERIAAGYAEMARAEPDRWIVVDGTPPKDELEAFIATRVEERLAAGRRP